MVTDGFQFGPLCKIASLSWKFCLHNSVHSWQSTIQLWGVGKDCGILDRNKAMDAFK